MRRLALGLLLVVAGFGAWALRALAADAPYVWPNLVRIAAGLLVLFGVGLVQRGREATLLRTGLFGFLVAALLVIPSTLASAIDWPNLISTLAGTVGAACIAYGAAHWYRPRGDPLSVAWVSSGFLVLAGNPGTYLVTGLLSRFDVLQGGWGIGSLLAVAGCLVTWRALPRWAQATSGPGAAGARLERPRQASRAKA
jgi:hypothetical protein